MILGSLKRRLLAAGTTVALDMAGVLVAQSEPAQVRGKPYVDPVGVQLVCDGYGARHRREADIHKWRVRRSAPRSGCAPGPTDQVV